VRQDYTLLCLVGSPFSLTARIAVAHSQSRIFFTVSRKAGLGDLTGCITTRSGRVVSTYTLICLSSVYSHCAPKVWYSQLLSIASVSLLVSESDRSLPVNDFGVWPATKERTGEHETFSDPVATNRHTIVARLVVFPESRTKRDLQSSQPPFSSIRTTPQASARP
jgi:hypothetical protein